MALNSSGKGKGSYGSSMGASGDTRAGSAMGEEDEGMSEVAALPESTRLVELSAPAVLSESAK